MNPWLVFIALPRLAGLTALVLLGLRVTSFAAAAGAPVVDRCVAAWAVSGLEAEEHARLAELCALGAAPTSADRPLLTAMVTRGSWEAAILGELVRGGAPHLDLGPDPDEGARLRRLREALRSTLAERGRLASPVCKDMRQSVRDYLADRAAGETPLPPFAAVTLAGERCLGLDATALGEVHFLTIPADNVTGLLVAAGTADRVVLQWLAPEETLEVDGQRLFVVVVPRWSVVTVQARRQDAGAPATWNGFVTRDATIWDRQPDAGCLRVSVAIDPDTVLLLDGEPVTRGVSLARRTLGVVAGEHEFVAVRCGEHGCSVRFRETIAEAARTATRNLCEDIEIDLKQSGSIAVLGTSSAPGCDQAIAWQVGVLASDYLRHAEPVTGKQFRDLKAYASLTDSLAALKTSLNPGAGQTVGARTGADSLDVIGTVAKEAWRQGIDDLVRFELSCDVDGDDYTLAGSVIDVREVFTRERGLQGLDLQDLLRVESVRVRGLVQLESAVSSVLDRLLGREFIRFREGPPDILYRQRARLEVLAYSREIPHRGGLPEVSAYLLNESVRAAPAVCQGLVRRFQAGALGSVAALLREPGRRRPVSVSVSRSEEHADTSTYAVNASANFYAPRPGTYLVLARWPGAGLTGRVVDATCVHFSVPDTELWGSVMFAPNLTTLNGVREYQATHLRVHLGKTWYRPVPWLGFGVFGAYTFSNIVDREGQPAWQDLRADQSKSRDRFQWYRHGVMLGPLVELRSRRATLPVEFRGRLSTGLGVAVVDVKHIDEDFTDFRTPELLNANDLRVAPVLDVILEIGVGYHAGPVSVAHTLMAGALSVNDMWSGSHAGTALNGSSLVVGLGLILGGGS